MYPYPLYPTVPGKLHIAFAIPDHQALLRLNVRMLTQDVLKHSGARLAPDIRFVQRGTIVNAINPAPGILDLKAHPVVNLQQVCFAHQAFSHATLISNYENESNLSAPLSQSIQHTRKELKFFPGFDIIPYPKPVDHPIPVQQDGIKSRYVDVL